MSEIGVTALDHAVQETNIWLKAIEKRLALTSRQHAYNALRAVLHVLRDRMPMAVAVNFGVQLPMLIRGIYYEGWHHAATPTKDRHLEYFVDDIFRQLPPQFPVDPLKVVRGIFEILWEKLDPGEFDKLMGHLPVSLRDLREPAT
jgi:uncharacterized protein (DUF2267 family)